MLELNEKQQEAVDCNDDRILVLAAAGSGKTAVLVERVARLVNEGVDTRSMLVLTFTNAAAFEMRQRFKERMPECAQLPEFRTFHAFCYRLIVRDPFVRSAIGYQNIPSIPYEGKIYNLKKEAIIQCGIKLSVKQLENKKRLRRKAEEKQYQLYKKALIRLIKQNNLITFDMLCYDVCKLFETNHESILKYKQQYKYLFVDEFQDTDMRQVRFLNSFPEGTKWWLCGDALQNIYAWRGTSNETLKVLSKSEHWTKIRMGMNYRCTNQICKYANARSKYADPAYRIEMVGQRDGDKVEEFFGGSSDQFHPVDMNHLREVVKQLKSITEESAILCRSNREVQFICEKFNDLQIEYTQSHKKSDFGHILHSCIHDDYMLNLLSSQLNSETHADFIRLRSQCKNPDINWFMNLYGNRTEIEKLGKQIIKARVILNKPIPNTDKVKELQKLGKLKFEITAEEVQNLNAIQLVEYLLDKLEEIKNTSIYVGTIHSVKGLEFPHVYVMGVNDFSFRVTDEEMKNLLYVALTRAKNHLTVCYGNF